MEKRKRYVTAIALMLVWVVVFGGPVEDRALSLLRQYDPDGFYIVDRYMNAPTSFSFSDGVSVRMGGTFGFSGYLRGSSDRQILASLNTVVHEMCHGFTSRIPLVLRSRAGLSRIEACAYYLEKGKTILVPRRGVFPSRLARELVPARFRKYRFSTYIHPSSANLGTQVEGVYGLMDEWNAYCHGTRTSVRLITEWLRLPAKEWVPGLADIYGTLYAGGEFKLYLLAALEYARLHRPDNYRQIMGNRAFITAFRRIDALWNRLYADADRVRERVFRKLRGQGYRVTMGNKFIMVFNPDGSGSGRGHFLDYLKELRNYLAGNFCLAMEKRLLSAPGDPGAVHGY